MCRYWTDAATSELVAEVLQALQQQQEHDAMHEAGSSSSSSSSSSSNEQQLLAFWLRVMPTADHMTFERS